MSDGRTAETGLVGNRGVLGINAFIDSQATTQTEYVVQVAGNAVQVETAVAYKLFREYPELRDTILGYNQAFIAQLSQTTACNRLHSLEQRLARWLLEAEDGLEANYIPLTHKFVAQMLGVRRAGVTEAAQKLQEQGSIQYRHGNIHLLNRTLLESSACECFGVAKGEYDRLLGVRERLVEKPEDRSEEKSEEKPKEKPKEKLEDRSNSGAEEKLREGAEERV